MSLSIYKNPAGQNKIQSAYDDLLKQMPSSSEQIYVETTQGKTFVIAAGPSDAPPVVLLHGSLSNSAAWIWDMTLWSQQFRVYAVDIIGEAGKSAQNRPTLNSQAYSAWLRDVFDALKLEKPVIVGISLGGWMALDFATTYPNHIGGLILLSPGGLGPNRNILSWALPYFFLGQWGSRKVYQKILGPLSAQVDLEHSELGKLLVNIATYVKPRIETLPIFADAQLAKVRVPVLLLLGDKDVTLYPQIIRDRVKKLWSQVQIEYLEQAGHFLGDQSKTIMDFLSLERFP